MYGWYFFNHVCIFSISFLSWKFMFFCISIPSWYWSQHLSVPFDTYHFYWMISGGFSQYLSILPQYIEPIFQTFYLLNTFLIPSSIHQAFILDTSRYLLNLSRSLILYIDVVQPSFILTQTSWYIFDSSQPHPLFLTKIPIPIPFLAYTKLQFIGKCSKTHPLFFSHAFHALRPTFLLFFFFEWILGFLKFSSNFEYGLCYFDITLPCIPF